MKLHRPIKPFAEHPAASIVLALLLILLGLAFACGWIPDSPHRRYFPGHQWVMAVLAWLLALFFAFCAYLGFKKKGPPDN